MNASLHSTVIADQSSGEHFGRDILRAADELRTAAGAEMKIAFPSRLKRYAIPGLPPSSISRARKGSSCSAAFRFSLVLLALRAGGASEAVAQRLIDWLQSVKDRLWASREIDPEQLDALIQMEQRIDASEDMEETDYLLRVPGSCRRWISHLRQRRAHDSVLIQALERAGGES